MGKLIRISVLALSLLTAACGVGLSDPGSDSARDEKNEKLRDEYEGIKGTYEGNIKISGTESTFPVRLYLFWSEVQEAPLPGDLKPGLRVVLRGRLMQQNYVGDSDNLILRGQYDSITGRLMLEADVAASTTSTGCRLGGQDPISISGTLTGAGAGGIVYRNEQEWARFEGFKRVSTDVSTGSILSEEQEYRRLRDLFEPVTGTYSGTLSRQLCSSGAPNSEDLQMLIYIERKIEGAGLNGAPCYVPRLMVRTLRENEGELADVTYRAVSRFDPINFLPQFQSQRIVDDSGSSSDGGNGDGGGKGGGGSGGGTSSAILEMQFDRDKAALTGTVFTTGDWGHVSVQRTNKTVIAPGDENILRRERRIRTYQNFTGEYDGSVKPIDKSAPNWWAHVKMYLDDAVVGGLRLPTLYAYFTRNKKDPIIGARLMTVTVIQGCKPYLVMHAEGNNNDPKFPGLGRMHFESEWLDGVMTGELSDHRGTQGTMTIKRVSK